MSQKTNVDYSPLKEYSKEEIEKFNERVCNFLEDASVVDELKKAVAYFYLTLHKLENVADEKRRGLTLQETHKVIRGLQGQILTLAEASISNLEQLKALKDIINNYFSQAQSTAQDYDWGNYDNQGECN